MVKAKEINNINDLKIYLEDISEFYKEIAENSTDRYWLGVVEMCDEILEILEGLNE